MVPVLLFLVEPFFLIFKLFLDQSILQDSLSMHHQFLWTGDTRYGGWSNAGCSLSIEKKENSENP